MKNKQSTPNNLLKKLYAFTQNKSKAFKRIMPVHKHIFWSIQHGELQISEIPILIQKQIAQYKPQNKLYMDQQLMLQCISIHDLFLGKQKEKEKFNPHQKKILKRQEERNISKQKSQKSLIQKQMEYKQRMKEYQKQKQLIEEKKKIQELKKIAELQEQEKKLNIQKQKQIQRQKQQKKKKLQAGLKQMQEKRKKRQQMIKQLAIQQKKSHSMKSLSAPKYLQIQKQYLEKQRRKAQQTKQFQRHKRQSMQLKIEQIKNHQKQYIERLKQKFTSKGGNIKVSQADTKSSQDNGFNVMSFRNQEEQQKHRKKAERRKQFQNRLRNIPIHVDINKKKQKQIQIDKSVNKQKYILLAKRHLDDTQIYNEFKDFQIKIDPKMIGKNYLDQLRQVPKAPKSERIGKQSSMDSLYKQPRKNIYINYLEELKQKNKSSRKLEPKLRQNDQLLKLVERSRKILKKHQQQPQNIYVDSLRVSLKQFSLPKSSDVPTKNRENQLKKQVTKSITEKISQYQRKVLKKVTDLKKISQYDESLKNQKEIDDLFSKVLKAKIETIDLT